MRRVAVCVCAALVLAASAGSPASGQDVQCRARIGVLITEDAEQALAQWGPTAEYLSASVPEYAFELVPLDHAELCQAVKTGTVDFFVADPLSFTEMEARYGVHLVATLRRLRLGRPYTNFGAVIFHRADRSDISQLQDLRGKTFIAVHEESLEGWRMAWREMKASGVDPYREFADLQFAGSDEAVVYAVRDGKAAAGTVPTGTLEQMALEGKIDLQDFKLLHEHGGSRRCIPLMHSTRLYPEWPFAAVTHMPYSSGHAVATVLLKLDADSPAAKAAGCAGWDVPHSYECVHECLRELRLPPYEDYGTITLGAVLNRYWPWLLLIAVLLTAMVLTTARALRLSFTQKQLRTALEYELAERKRTEETLNHRLEFERLITTMSTNFVNLATDEIDDAINDALRQIGEFANVDRSFVFLYRDSGASGYSTHEWCAEGIESQIQNCQNFVAKDFPWCGDRVARFETVNIPRVADLPPEAIDRRVFESQQIRSLLMVPMVYRKSLYGSVGFSSVRTETVWSEGSIALLKMTGEVFAGALKRKQAEEEHARLAVAIAQAGEAIVVTDPDGVIQYVNPAFEHITGYTRQQAVGQKPSLLKSGKHDESFYAELWDTISRGDVWSGHFHNKKQDGTLYEEEATISPVRDESGRIINYVGVKRDVTHEVELEAQLRQAMKMEAVGQLAGGVAHDFNNILTAILGNAELMQAELETELPSDDSLLTRLAQINRSSQRAVSLTRHLLAFSRRQVVNPEALDPNRILREMEGMLHRLIGENVLLELAVEPDVKPVWADAGQFEQVIMNLVVNARDAMPDGGRVTIETANVTLDESYVATHPGANAGPHVLLAVRDTGCGMDKQIVERIFEPFFTTKDIGQGTGLGLSTVYGIVRQANGYVTADSQPGSGATFNVYLPAADAAFETQQLQPAEAQETLGGHETVLLCEDEQSVRVLAGRILESAGYTVLEAHDALHAQTLADNHSGPVHLLLTDVIMPDMNGKRLADAILAKRPDTRVLYVSGYPANVIARHGVLDEGVSFLQKPFSFQSLLMRVRVVLDDQCQQLCRC